jgi:hypothetical protein
MKHRGITESVEWIFGKGKSSYDTETKAIATNVKSRLFVF